MRTDMVDLHEATIDRSPQDIADWPITVDITGASMSPNGGLRLFFDREIPDSWKWPTGGGSDNFQFTVWAGVFNQAARVFGAAGFVQMWQGRSMSDGSLPPILEGYQNWWGDPRNLWPSMASYVPKPGDRIVLLASAGNARLVESVTSVRERTNAVVITLQVGDVGSWTFDAPPVVDPPVVEPPTPPTPPTPADDTVRQLLEQVVAHLVDQGARLQHVEQIVAELQTALRATPPDLAVIGQIAGQVSSLLTVAQAIEHDLEGVKTVNSSTADRVATVASNLSPLIALLAALKHG